MNGCLVSFFKVFMFYWNWSQSVLVEKGAQLLQGDNDKTILCYPGGSRGSTLDMSLTLSFLILLRWTLGGSVF